MDLVHVRIDDRLVHGQVTVGWSKHVRPTRIIVADDKAAANPLQRGVLQMIPIPGARVSVMPLAEFLQLTREERGGDRVFLIVSNPTELLKLLEGGLRLTKVVVGNLGYQTGRQKISKEVYANEAELAAFRELSKRGIKLLAQWTPTSPTMDLNRELEKVR
jgi:mannose/fructose/N-acetylgalactosamine-specific phosphotransferase system component IIB